MANEDDQLALEEYVYADEEFRVIMRELGMEGRKLFQSLQTDLAKLVESNEETDEEDLL